MTSLTSRVRSRPGFLSALIVAGVLLLAALLGWEASARWLAVLVGGLAFWLLLRQPGWGLVALAGLSFTVPFSLGTGTEVDLTPPVFLVPVVILAWLVNGLRRGEVRLPTLRPALPLLLFALSGLISLLAGHTYWDPAVPKPDNLLLVQLAQWGIYALSAAVFLVAAELGRDAGWLRAATWLFLLLAGIVVLELYLPAPLRVLGWSEGDMADRSMFWVWLGALAAGQLFFNRRLKPVVRLGLLVLLLASALNLVWLRRTWSSGWVPFGAAVLVVGWLRIWRQNRGLALAAIPVLVVLAVMFYPVLFEHAGGEQELDMAWGGRQLLYKRVFETVKDHPVLGLGPAAYRFYGLTRWLGLGVGRALWLQPQISSHNNYLDVYAQMGLVGLALFLWFLAEVGWLGWRLAPRTREDFGAGYVYGVLGGLAGTLVAMMLADWFLPFVYNIGFPGFRTSALAWMFLGGLVALAQMASAEERI